MSLTHRTAGCHPVEMRHPTLTTPAAVALTAATLLLAGCGDNTPAQQPAAKPTADPQTQDACRIFDKEIRQTVDNIRKNPEAGLNIASPAKILAQPKIEAAARLAQDPVKTSLEKVVAAIDLFNARAQEFLHEDYDHTTELAVLKNAITTAQNDCAAAGVPMNSTI